MRPGDICFAAARGACTGKPRPVAIIQDDRLDSTASATVVPADVQPCRRALVRITVERTDTMGTENPSQTMIDKVTTRPRVNLRDHVGHLTSPMPISFGLTARP